MEKTLWQIYDDAQLAELDTLTADYKKFLDAGKTERECVTEVIRIAEKEGYVDLNKKDTLQAGDKVYMESGEQLWERRYHLDSVWAVVK